MGREELGEVRALLRDADAVIIAASNGFDVADGYNQFSCDREYLRVFGDLRQRYGVGQRNQAIKAPLMAWSESAPLASYDVLNREDPVLPSLPPERVASACGDLGEALVALAEGAR